MAVEIQGIDHVQSAVPRALEEACVAFYRQVFGFPDVPKPETLRSRGGAWFQVGAMQMHIGVDPEASPPSRRHVCFLVADIAAARATVAALGIAIEGEGTADGLTRFFVRDPAGNRIEFGQRR